MTTLENSYCVPRTVEEWDMLYPNANWQGQYPSEGLHVYWNDNGKHLASWPNEDPNRTEIPVARFLDLTHDRICPWRLEEVGWEFIDRIFPYYYFKPNDKVILSWSEKQQDAGVGFELADDATWVNITTFTDLLTLIRMLTPPSR